MKGQTRITAVSWVLLGAAMGLGCGAAPGTPTQVVGIWHEVASGDTVAGIAVRYGADAAATAELNDLSVDGTITDRKVVFVLKAGGKAPGIGAPPPPPLLKPATTIAQTTAQKVRGQCSSKSGSCLAWPVKGQVISRFGLRAGVHHDGIDITASKGTPITSAGAGKVLYSGNEIKGYGNLIILRHGDGLLSIYAHCEEIVVREGATVKKGELIGRVGNTGTARGVHLHFEIRANEEPQDPLNYLP